MTSKIKTANPVSLLLAAIGLFLPAAFTHAQEEAPTVKVDLTSLSLSGSVKGLFYMNDDKIEEFKAYPRGFSSPLAYKGDATIDFYADKSALLLPADERPEPVAIAHIPSNTKDVLLIFIALGNGKYRIISQDSSTEEFPPQAVEYTISPNSLLYSPLVIMLRPTR